MSDIALVTGTSSGMGLHTAVESPVAGAHRRRDDARHDARDRPAARRRPTTAGVEVDVRALDVTDHEAARACVDGGARRPRPHRRARQQRRPRRRRDGRAAGPRRDPRPARGQLPRARRPDQARPAAACGDGRRARCSPSRASAAPSASPSPTPTAARSSRSRASCSRSPSSCSPTGCTCRSSSPPPSRATSSATCARPVTPGRRPVCRPARRLPRPLRGCLRQRPVGADAAAPSPMRPPPPTTASAGRPREGATAFVGMSLADPDGERVLGATRTWIAELSRAAQPDLGDPLAARGPSRSRDRSASPSTSRSRTAA